MSVFSVLIFLGRFGSKFELQIQFEGFKEGSKELMKVVDVQLDPRFYIMVFE